YSTLWWQLMRLRTIPSARLHKRYVGIKSRHPGKVFYKYFILAGGPTPHSMTMDIGMPAENITQLTRGELSFTREMASIFERRFGPIVHHLVTLQNFYDLEMYAWQVEVLFAKRKIFRRISRENRWAVSKEEEAALADIRDIIRTIVRKKRVMIM